MGFYTEYVEQQRCTCGANLPEDARFCHKCGKPQYEEDIARLAESHASTPVQAPISPVTSAAPLPISFRNSRAVLISLVVAAVAFFASMLAAVVWPPLFFLVLCTAGYTAAKLYRGQTVEPLTSAGGARLGWMTGLWLFLLMTVLCAIAAVYLSTPEGWQQAEVVWRQFPEMSKGIGSQHDVLSALLMGIPFLFVFLTLFTGLGGMLGAKSAPPRRPSA